jgi:hypothetical protein
VTTRTTLRMTPSGDITILHDFAVHGGVEQGLLTGLIRRPTAAFAAPRLRRAGGGCVDYQWLWRCSGCPRPDGDAAARLHRWHGVPYAPLIRPATETGTTGQGIGGRYSASPVRRLQFSVCVPVRLTIAPRIRRRSPAPPTETYGTYA